MNDNVKKKNNVFFFILLELAFLFCKFERL